MREELQDLSREDGRKGDQAPLRYLKGAEVRRRLIVYPMTRGPIETIGLKAEQRNYLAIYVAVLALFGSLNRPEVARLARTAELHTK